jgi:solute carrier family 25 carnitine/acylcarnitine transporter 20/29
MMQPSLPALYHSCSGLGGITYWVTIFPVDCIKSAMQTDSIVKSQRKYTDVLTTVKVSESDDLVPCFSYDFVKCCHWVCAA